MDAIPPVYNGPCETNSLPDNNGLINKTATQDSDNTTGMINFVWDKKFIGIQGYITKIHVYVNNVKLPPIKFNSHTSFNYPIPSQNVTIRVKHSFRSSTKSFALKQNENYVCKITYNVWSGAIGMEMYAYVLVPTLVKIG